MRFNLSLQDGGSLDQVLKEAGKIPEEILGKVSIAVRCFPLLFTGRLAGGASVTKGLE